MIQPKRWFRKLAVVRCVRGDKLEAGIPQRMPLQRGRCEEIKAHTQVGGVKDKGTWIQQKILVHSIQE